MKLRHVVAALWEGSDLPGYSAGRYNVDDVLNVWRGVQKHITNGVLHIYCDGFHFRQLAASTKLDVSFSRASPANVHVQLLDGEGTGGWTNLLECFDPGLFYGIGSGAAALEPGERALFVGLDTVFVGNSDWLFDWNEAPVGLPCDPASPEKNPPCNAVVSFNGQGAALIQDEYARACCVHPFPHMYNGVRSEMVLLQHLWKENKWPLLEGRKMERLVSYRCYGVAQRGLPANCSVVYFHGAIKPRDLPAHDVVRQHMAS